MLISALNPVVFHRRKVIQLVASGGANAVAAGGSSTTAVTAAADTSRATCLAVGVAQYFGGGSSGTPVITDNYGNIWTSGTGKASDSAVSRVQLFFTDTDAPKVGPGHTFTCNGLEMYPVIVFWAFSGTAARPLDQEASSQGGGTAQSLAIGIIPVQYGSAIVSILGVEGGAVGSLAATAPMSSVYGDVSGTAGTTGGAGAYAIQAHPILINPTWVWTTSRTDVSTASMALKAA